MRNILATLTSLALLVSLAACSTGPGSADVTVSQQATSEWSMSAAPNYYQVTGSADLSDDTVPTTPSIVYSPLDELGRAGKATGLITKTMRDEGSKRERNMPDQIAGWPEHNPKVAIRLDSGKQYRGFLFNRSHLIAKSLGGEDIPANMVTGTRTQNVGDNQPAGGMAYTETKARNWLDNHPDGTIIYVAEPHYQGSELLPRTVSVDIISSDKSINEHVVTYNSANGFDIDYQHGGVVN